MVAMPACEANTTHVSCLLCARRRSGDTAAWACGRRASTLPSVQSGRLRRSRARRGEGRHRTLERAAAACRDMLWSPMIRAALIAGTPWLDVFCPGCGTSRAIDLRKADRHPLASVATLVLGLRCSWCPECERRMAVNFTRPAGAVRNYFGSPHSTPQFGSDFRFNGGAWVDEAEQNRWQTAMTIPPGKLSFRNGIDGPQNISRRATRRVAMMKRGSSVTCIKFVRSSCRLVASTPGRLCVDG